MPRLATCVSPSLSSGEHGMSTMVRGAERGANWPGACRLPSVLICLAPMAEGQVRGPDERQSVETACPQGDAAAPRQQPGRRFLPPPPPPNRLSGGESGRERPPCLTRRMAPRSFQEGRSRPDSEPRSSGSFWPSASPVHDPLVLPNPWPPSRRGDARAAGHVPRHRLSGRTDPWR